MGQGFQGIIVKQKALWRLGPRLPQSTGAWANSIEGKNFAPQADSLATEWERPWLPPLQAIVAKRPRTPHLALSWYASLPRAAG